MGKTRTERLLAIAAVAYGATCTAPVNRRGTRASVDPSRWAVAAFLATGLVTCSEPGQSQAQTYESMAPFNRYASSSKDEEIALARTAAPASISSAAEVLVLGPSGYEIAVRGTNGFVCIVERSWNGYLDDPEFWNPRIRAPTCYNAPASRSVVPAYLLRTTLVLAGLDKKKIGSRLAASVADGTVREPADGSMCYMMSPAAHLSDAVGHASPHLMFFYSRREPAFWGANLKGSPIRADQGAPEPLTILTVPTAAWSDGRPVISAQH